MNTPNRQPAGVPTGGQFAASMRDESGVHLDDIAVRRCASCRQTYAGDGGCINTACGDFDMANPDARFAEHPIRVHALRPGDLVTLGDGSVATVHACDIDPPGHGGRRANLTTDRGVHGYPINAFITTTRPEPVDEEAEFYDEGPCCSICDAPGHGYPGGGPCPTEVNEQQRWETDEDERRAALMSDPWNEEPPF